MMTSIEQRGCPRGRASARATRAAVALALVLALAVASGACGESPPPPAKVAETPPPPVTARPATPAPGQTVGVSTGGADLTGDAKAAYDQGFSAWK